MAGPSSGGPSWLTDVLTATIAGSATTQSGGGPPGGRTGPPGGMGGGGINAGVTGPGTDPKSMSYTQAQWTVMDAIANGQLAKDTNGNWYNPQAADVSTFDHIMEAVGMIGGIVGLAAVGGAAFGAGDLGAAGGAAGGGAGGDLWATAYGGGGISTDTGLSVGAFGGPASGGALMEGGAISVTGAGTAGAGVLSTGLTAGQLAATAGGAAALGGGVAALGSGSTSAGGFNQGNVGQPLNSGSGQVGQPTNTGTSLGTNPGGAVSNPISGITPASSSTNWLQDLAKQYPNLTKYGPGVVSAAESIYSGYQQNKAAQAAIAASNPFGPYRAQYAQQLQTLMSNPGSVTQLPGYQYGMDQATQATARQMAAGGYLGSGNEAVALMNTGLGYSTNVYQTQLQNLAMLAGAGTVPNATGAGLSAMSSGASQTQSGLNQLGALMQLYMNGNTGTTTAAATSPWAGS